MTETAAADAAFTTVSTSRAIVRCSAKGCRKAHRTDVVTTSVLRAFNGRPHYTRTVTTPRGEAAYRDRHDLARIVVSRFECTGCGGRYATVDMIDGRFSESVKCGARCRGAVGPSCECQCGGENHASAHAAI